MANMDGSNRTLLFSGQKGPVGMCLPACSCRLLIPQADVYRVSGALGLPDGLVLTPPCPRSTHPSVFTALVLDSMAVTPIPLPGLAIDFPESKLYWISSGNHTINRCNLDGSGLEIIDTMRSQLGKATALAIMGEGLGGRRDGRRAGQAQLDGGGGRGFLGPTFHPGSLMTSVGGLSRGPFPRVLFRPVAPGDKLWWADQLSEKMGTCNKADGSGSVVLRNSTTLVMHMKVYDENIQLGKQWVRDAVSRGRAAVGMGVGELLATSSLPE